jgi:hypothetical protein
MSLPPCRASAPRTIKRQSAAKELPDRDTHRRHGTHPEDVAALRQTPEVQPVTRGRPARPQETASAATTVRNPRSLCSRPTHPTRCPTAPDRDPPQPAHPDAAALTPPQNGRPVDRELRQGRQHLEVLPALAGIGGPACVMSPGAVLPWFSPHRSGFRAVRVLCGSVGAQQYPRFRRIQSGVLSWQQSENDINRVISGRCDTFRYGPPQRLLLQRQIRTASEYFDHGHTAITGQPRS